HLIMVLTSSAKLIKDDPVVRTDVDEAAPMDHFLWQAGVAVVFSIDILDAVQHNLLGHARVGFSLPGECVARFGLAGAIDDNRVVRASRSKEVSPVARAIVNRSSRVDEQLAAAAKQCERQRAGMAVTAGHHAEPAAVEEQVTVFRAATRALKDVTGICIVAAQLRRTFGLESIEDRPGCIA